MPPVAKTWRLLPHEPDALNRLAGELGVSPVVAQLLFNRGLRESAVARKFLEVEASHQIVKSNGKVVAIHLPGEKLFQAAVGTMQAVDVHAIAGTICRLEERKALNVIPVRVTHE